MRCWECTLVQPLWKAVWSYLKKLKMQLPHDPVILLLEIYLKSLKTLIQKNISTLMFIAVLFTVAKIWKQPMLISRRVNKTAMVHLHNGILPGCKKGENFTLCVSKGEWVDLENIMPREISQSKKDRYHGISLVCGI